MVAYILLWSSTGYSLVNISIKILVCISSNNSIWYNKKIQSFVLFKYLLSVANAKARNFNNCNNNICSKMNDLIGIVFHYSWIITIHSLKYKWRETLFMQYWKQFEFIQIFRIIIARMGLLKFLKFDYFCSNQQSLRKVSEFVNLRINPLFALNGVDRLNLAASQYFVPGFSKCIPHSFHRVSLQLNWKTQQIHSPNWNLITEFTNVDNWVWTNQAAHLKKSMYHQN